MFREKVLNHFEKNLNKKLFTFVESSDKPHSYFKSYTQNCYYFDSLYHNEVIIERTLNTIQDTIYIQTLNQDDFYNGTFDISVISVEEGLSKLQDKTSTFIINPDSSTLIGNSFSGDNIILDSSKFFETELMTDRFIIPGNVIIELTNNSTFTLEYGGVEIGERLIQDNITLSYLKLYAKSYFNNDSGNKINIYAIGELEF